MGSVVHLWVHGKTNVIRVGVGVQGLYGGVQLTTNVTSWAVVCRGVEGALEFQRGKLVFKIRLGFEAVFCEGNVVVFAF